MTDAGNQTSGSKATKSAAQTAKNNLKKKVETFSNSFYNHIPHDVGHQRMSTLTLDTIEKVNAKIELMDMLLNFKSSTDSAVTSTKLNVIDAHYERIDTKIAVLPLESPEASTIKKFAESTIASNHQSLKIKIDTIFKLEKSGENKDFTKELTNKRLLWHGSKMTNFAGILSHGIQPPPPEAPNTGYQFGKGLYFLDVFSKAVLN